MDNCIAVHFSLASHGGICAIAHTSCCTWINEAVKMDQAIHCFKKNLFGFLRLILMAYDICSLGLGWAIWDFLFWFVLKHRDYELFLFLSQWPLRWPFAFYPES